MVLELQYIEIAGGRGGGGDRNIPRFSVIDKGEGTCIYFTPEIVDRFKAMNVSSLAFHWFLRDDGRLEVKLLKPSDGRGSKIRFNEDGKYEHSAPHVRCENISLRKIIRTGAAGSPVECEVEWRDGMPVYILPECFKLEEPHRGKRSK